MLLLVSDPTSASDDFPRGNPYGEQRPYGRHPGIDFMVGVGTPVIAPADGKVSEIRNFDGPRPWQGGWVVRVSHAKDFHSAYLHLTQLHVEMGQPVKRGQLIGLSGASNSGHAHLHFGACGTAGKCFDFPYTSDPEKFWLGGKPQCFEPGNDYSRHSQRELTLPLACGDYAKELVARIKRAGSK
jgi:hypothetical protein